ncbi:MAG TPA: ATP-binding protein, partial [Pseudolabrys sp.]|nr:ATP-binding protein [Pseudolabrys sp.]
QSVIDGAFSVLEFSRRDFPFALLYMQNEARAWSADAADLADHPWPLEHSDAAGVKQLTLPADRTFPGGAWKLPPQEALIVPIPGAGGEQTFGSLVLGLNPHRPHDPYIRDIARLVAGQIGGALANIEALQSERRRAERIWSYSRDLLVVSDTSGIFLSVSPAWTRILGHPLDDVVGRHFRDFIFPDDVAPSLEAFERATHNTNLTAFENRFVGTDGKARWFSWHTSTEQDLVYSYGRDITEEKQHAAALAAAEAALRQAQKMEAVGQLTGGIAHDFNNLLTGIIGSIEMMKRRSGEGRIADADRYATAASAAAHRAAALTQRLLAFSRRQPLDAKTIDVNALVDDMAELIRRSIGEAIELKLDVQRDLWFAKCDANQLESAVLNLAINARDAMPQGGRLIIQTENAHVDVDRIERFRLAGAGDFVVISVTDTGHGMSADVREKAFEPFFTTKPIGQGTGLGLSMIYGFVRQSGGFIELDSEEGQGTTVRLYLPRSEAAQSHINSADVAHPVNRTERSETILVVEDESAVRAIVVDALRDAGYRTLEAGDGAAGLKFVQASGRIDLLVSDVGLPGGLNGRQLADAARLLRPQLPVLFMTAYAHNIQVDAGALEAGMELIAKPFAVDALIERVNRVLAAAP